MQRSLGRITDTEFQTLLEQARNGDQAAFAALWRVFNPPLMRFLAGMADREDALDLASTVWLEIVRGLDRFAGDAAGFRSWIFTIGRLRAVDLRRAQGRRPQIASSIDVEGREAAPDDPAADVEQQWTTDQAIDLIRTLPPDQAEVLLLRIVADLDVATVAAIVDKRPGTVRVLAHRGLRQLARRLNPDPIQVTE
ncbi:MAG: RNA polymerase sigma factor [Acidimicrobiales bacterium]